jgi:hypothetical protein
VVIFLACPHQHASFTMLQAHETTRRTWLPAALFSGGACMQPVRTNTCIGCFGRQWICWLSAFPLVRWRQYRHVHAWHVCVYLTACKRLHDVPQHQRTSMPRASRCGRSQHMHSILHEDICFVQHKRFWTFYFRTIRNRPTQFYYPRSERLVKHPFVV